MGQGGYLNLVNATFVDWHLRHHNSYQMDNWNFPPVIPAGQGIRVYIEWHEGLFTHTKDDAAEAVYEMYGTGRQFEIQARSNPFRIQIFYKLMEALHKPRGHVDNLGWRHDADVTFVLMERVGLLHSVCDEDMGEGGYLNLINSTFSDWQLKHYHYYQMNNWAFPPLIKAGEAAHIYIEWDEGIFKHWADDAGEAVYELSGTGKQFEIQARAAPYRIQVCYTGIETLGKPKGFTDYLGWRPNGVLTFVLTERGGFFNAICS